MLWSISASVENMGSCEELTTMFPTINAEKHVKRAYMHTWDKRKIGQPHPPLLAPPPSPAYRTLSLFAYKETMSILATADFSQAVYLARKVSDTNKSALCSSFGCACAHTHSDSHTHTPTQDSCLAWRVFGYRGNLSMEYVAHPLDTQTVICQVVREKWEEWKIYTHGAEAEAEDRLSVLFIRILNERATIVLN